MKNLGFLAFILLMCFTSCSSDDEMEPTQEDPCEIEDNLACDTQDFDMDGVTNGEDSAPEDFCIPNMPEFEVFVVGTWEYSLLGVPGEIKINADGTYEDIENTLLSVGEVVSRMWTASTDPTTLTLRVQSSTGLSSSLNLEASSAECNMIEFLVPGVENFIFIRK